MPKSIRFSVGRGGQNVLPQDVMTVQYLLNCVPTSKGGPSPELVVDGIAGPKTMAAISDFQRGSLSSPDGRVDPGGPTLARLQQFDPYPDQPMPPAASFPKSPAGYKKESGPPGYKDLKIPGWKQAGQPGYKDLWPGGTKQAGSPGNYKQASPEGYPPATKQAGTPGDYKQAGPPGYKVPGYKSGGW
ncbi:MAG TPA: peptidoglycan-binding domain-containing protein [Bryobacteraceae bacterium]|nr:peptidoglycan-binding domain-containing protein [Bryobacteraceae bacterium]